MRVQRLVATMMKSESDGSFSVRRVCVETGHGQGPPPTGGGIIPEIFFFSFFSRTVLLAPASMSPPALDTP
jgi:hypothetical protein